MRLDRGQMACCVAVIAMWAAVLCIAGCGQTEATHGKTLYTEASTEQLTAMLEKETAQVASLASIDSQTKKSAETLQQAAETLQEIRDLLQDQKQDTQQDTLTSLDAKESLPLDLDAKETVQTAAPPRPTLFVAYASFHCPPCELLKADIEAGKFADFEVVEQLKPGTDSNGYPVIRWVKPDGLSKWVNGYGPGTLQSLKDEILYGKLPVTTAAYTGTQPGSLVRMPGPSWHFDGDWTPSPREAARHLEEAHGISAAGLSVQEMKILHDNAHNAGRQTVSAPVRRVRGQVRFGSCPTCL